MPENPVKVQSYFDGEILVLALSGRINDENLGLLETIVQSGKRPLALDMEEVSLVGRGVVQFLVRCESDGVMVRTCPGYIREWIAQARARLDPAGDE